MYFVLGLAGLRHGEGAALRWGDFDADVKLLGRITVARSRLYQDRRDEDGPVHPTLAAVLAEWRLQG